MKDASKTDISVVIPVYGSDEVLRELHSRTSAVLKEIVPTYEIIFVNDASPDRAWEIIRELAAIDTQVRGLNLSRNFGQYPAITAGLSASRGEWVVVMDCDLQDQPEEIEKIYAKAREGYAVVVGSRTMRHDSFFRSFSSRVFYALLSFVTGIYQDHTVANFGIYHHRVVETILSMPDRTRYFSAMVRWVGFRTAVVPVAYGRRHGASGYSFWKLLNLGIDTILAFSERPLRIIGAFGVIVSVFSSIYIVLIFGGWIFSGSAQSIHVLIGSAWLIFGLISTILGVMALYIGKIFEEAKGRPIYIVEEEL